MAASKYKFIVLGKSKFVHSVRTKAQDLKQGGTGSQCQTVRKYWVADKIDTKHKGMSPEAASALDPCPNCDTAGVLASMVTPEQKRAKAKEKADDLIDRIRDENKPKGKKGKGKSAKATGERVKVNTRQRVRSNGDSTREKAEALALFGKEHGWGTDVIEADPGLLVKAIKGGEVIQCYFIDGKYDAGRPASVSVGSWTGKLRGVHGCRKQMAGEGRDRPHAEPGKGRSAPRKKAKQDDAHEESPEDAKAKVPFDVESDDDPTVMKALLGKQIRWRNGVSGAIDEALLPGKAKGKKRDVVTITTHPKTGRRMVTFLTVLSAGKDDDGEFREQYGPERSVYLDKITKVVG